MANQPTPPPITSNPDKREKAAEHGAKLTEGHGGDNSAGSGKSDQPRGNGAQRRKQSK